jgi:SAM-dependent methyltransferase
MRETHGDVTGSVQRYYTSKLQDFGPTPRGVDWRDGASQVNRFDVLLQVVGDRGDVDLLDFGCGYGALLDHPTIVKQCATYVGLDISSEMIETARRVHRSCGVQHPQHEFKVADSVNGKHEVVVASGIFNVKLATPDAAWKAYIWDTIRMIADQTTAALAYNCLSSRSDSGKRREDLHYADQSEHVSFLSELGFETEVADDYGLYEFTIFARR